MSLNLYTYCHNNPVIFTDPSGHEPQGCYTYEEGDENSSNYVTVEVLIHSGSGASDFYGHADLEIGGTVYAYGRYDSESIWGFMGTKGDGVLVVADADLYIDMQNEHGKDVTGYTLNVKSQEAQAIEDYFLNEISENGIYWDSRETIDSDMYKFTDDSEYYQYEFLGGDNCATVTVDALKSVLGDRVSIPIKNAYSPASLQQSLESEDYIENNYGGWYGSELITDINYYTSN